MLILTCPLVLKLNHVPRDGFGHQAVTQSTTVSTRSIDLTPSFQSSFIGAIAIGDLVKSTMGPKGMDKILVSMGNDGYPGEIQVRTPYKKESDEMIPT